jgi:glucosamine-6-phosphate deaminase
MDFIKEIKVEKLMVKIYGSRKVMGQESAKEVAMKIKNLLLQKKEINIIFAAAPSQSEFMAYLISDSEINWGRINAFHMDEYIGLDTEDPQSFGCFLRDSIFGKVRFKTVNYLNGNAEDLELECKRYSELLKQYPTDIVCMGIGENGHIAFNDPQVAFFNDDKMVKVVKLDDKCRNQQVNDGCFSSLEKVPVNALTLTIPSLLAGTFIFCMVPAKTKAEAVYNTLNGEIKETCPASILKTHNNAILYTDIDSASLILKSKSLWGFDNA